MRPQVIDAATQDNETALIVCWINFMFGAPFGAARLLAIAARMMRHILTDYGRARQSGKRGGGVVPLTLDEERVASMPSTDIVDLDDALNELAKVDERKADVLVLHYFGGMTYEETAEALNISEATVDRDLRLAKAWLANELQDD